MRTLSATTLAGMMAERASGIQVQAAIIEHAASGTIFRIVRNTEDIIHSGERYTAVGFEFEPPEESETGFATAQLTLNNVDQWLTPTIRNLRGEINVTLLHLSATNLAASPPVFDTVDLEISGMTVQSVEMNSTTARCSLSFDGVSDQSYPGRYFSPGDFAGIFGSLSS